MVTMPCSNRDSQKSLLQALLNAALDGCDWVRLVQLTLDPY
jgi:hypothetical protein